MTTTTTTMMMMMMMLTTMMMMMLTTMMMILTTTHDPQVVYFGEMVKVKDYFASPPLNYHYIKAHIT